MLYLYTHMYVKFKFEDNKGIRFGYGYSSTKKIIIGNIAIIWQITHNFTQNINVIIKIVQTIILTIYDVSKNFHSIYVYIS